MKLLLTAATLLLATIAFGQAPAKATYVPHDKVEAGGTLATGVDHRVSILRRMGPGQVEVHEKETDIFYVLEGEATFVTGGTVVGGKTTGPGEIRGTDIQGGDTVQLTKGDVIVIPAGMPHWFKAVPKLIRYHTVKVVKP
jgi:mannose-6-phosphate isomerase-like protein (cupin superfamily)